jgi:hypothetical protein
MVRRGQKRQNLKLRTQVHAVQNGEHLTGTPDLLQPEFANECLSYRWGTGDLLRYVE